MAAKDFIVAIEIGSSKIVGVAGEKDLDGSISVLAVVKEDSSSFIRKGVVYNISQTAQCISNIAKKLSEELNAEIVKVFVGVGGQSIRSVKNVIVKDLPGGTIVTQAMVNELMDLNRSMSYQGQEILDVATQEYKVDSQLQVSPVGIQCSRLEGNFLNITWRNTFYNNLNKCFDMAGVAIAEMFISPIALADSVLSDSEKRSGCVLVDLGADTTSVSIYYKNILRHLAVIPLGGDNITKDISSLQIDETLAEKMKLKHACAYTENSDIDSVASYPVDAERSVESRKFIEIVEGRVREIVENVWHQVPAEYTDRLLGGIVLTGGGANMKNIEKAFAAYTNIEKIRVAKFVKQPIASKCAEALPHDCTMNSVLGILAKGNMNCAGESAFGNADMVAEQEAAQPSARQFSDYHQPRRAYDRDAGQATRPDPETLRLKAAEEAAKRAAAEEQERQHKDKKGGMKKFLDNMKTMLSKLITED